MSEDLEYLIIQHLSGPVVTSLKQFCCPLATEKNSPKSRSALKRPPRVYISCCGIFWLLVSYSVNFFSCDNTSEELERDPDTLEPAVEIDIQMEYSSD
jgi:hypothetical protein